MSDDKPQLRDIGVSSGGSMPEQGIQLSALLPSDATTLRDLLGEYVFYTPALIYLTLPLVRDPFYDWCDSLDETVVPLEFVSDTALFFGLYRQDQYGTQQWNNRVLAMPRQHWDSYHQFMLTVAFHGKGSRKLARVRSREVEIVDPLWLRKQATYQPVVQSVPITAFCLDTDKGCLYIENDGPLPKPPRIVISPQAFPDTVALGQAIADEQLRPYEYADAARTQEEKNGTT